MRTAEVLEAAELAAARTHVAAVESVTAALRVLADAQERRIAAALAHARASEALLAIRLVEQDALKVERAFPDGGPASA